MQIEVIYVGKPRSWRLFTRALKDYQHSNSRFLFYDHKRQFFIISLVNTTFAFLIFLHLNSMHMPETIFVRVELRVEVSLIFTGF